MSRKKSHSKRLDWLAVLCGRAALVAACLLFFASAAHAGKAPMKDKDVPLYPGAKADKEAEAAMSEESPEEADDATGVKRLRSSFRKGYSTAASAEEVFEFYRKKLSAVEGKDGEQEDPAPGFASRVSFDVSFYSVDVKAIEKCEECDATPGMKEHMIQSAKRNKSLLSKHRKPLAQEKWMRDASFSWSMMETNGDETSFRVSIEDASISLDDSSDYSYTPRTFVHVRRETRKSQEAFDREVEEAASRQHEREHDKKVKALAAGKVFKPEDAGVPLYPGARYEAEATKSLRETFASDGVSYVTDDSAKKVAEFYNGKGGLELMDINKEGAWLKRCKKEYNQYLKQTMSTGECDIDVTAQSPWMARIGGKKNKSTLITFIRTKTEGAAQKQPDDAPLEEPMAVPEKSPESAPKKATKKASKGAPAGNGVVPEELNKLKNLLGF